MERRQELTLELRQYLQTGALLDAAGFGGAETSFDLVDFVEAARDILAHEGRSGAYRDYLQASLAAEYEALQGAGFPLDCAASYLVGSVLWRGVVDEMNGAGAMSASTMDRVIHDIALSRQAFGYGDERYVHRALVRYTEDFGSDYPRNERAKLRSLCLQAEDECHRVKTLSPMRTHAERSQRVPYRTHLVRGLASISMMYGYSVQPPPEQTDENGAWRLPEEYEGDDDR